MHSILTYLKPMDMDKLPINDKRYSMMWSRLIASDSDELKAILQLIYFKVLDAYLITRRAMPLSEINRPLNKRWAAMFTAVELPKVDIGTALKSAVLSKTIPLNVTAIDGGKIMLLPSIVFTTIISRQVYNMSLLEKAGLNSTSNPTAKPEGLVTDIPHSEQAVLEGSEDGPILSERGMIAAYAPFEAKPVMPENVISDNNIDTI